MILTRIIIGLLVLGFFPAGSQDSRASSRIAERQSPFFAYLKDKRLTPALVAYSPSDYDPRPEKRKVPSPDSIAADLKALRPAFDGLVLYGYNRDVTPGILAEAKRQRYRAILLGIWDPTSAEEVAGVAALVKKYDQGLALAVCIGNEGIAFNRYHLDDVTLASKILRDSLGPGHSVPLCTSEPFGQYDQVDLQEFGDFLAPNIHPVFDQPKLGAVEAVSWVRERAQALAATARKPLLVKETGAPHGGDARFTPKTQEAFWQSYRNWEQLVIIGEKHWVSYAAAFESFDLPWKAEQSKMPIEEAWGLLSVRRIPYPAFHVWERRNKVMKRRASR